jgi:hypothetical protein
VINIHPIQQLVLDLQFIGIKESNNYLFDKVSNLSNNKLTTILSNFFDDSRFEQLHYELNIIEIDLGVIPYEQFEEKFIEKFTEALILKFKDLLENSNNKDNYILKDAVQNYYEILKYYLLNGRLPWWSTKFHSNNIKRIFDEFISKHPNNFRHLLYEIGKDDHVRRRIAYSLSNDLILNIIEILKPTEFEYFFSYHDYIIKVNNKNTIINESESNLSKAVWYNILSYILTDSSSLFEKKEFLKRNLMSISSFYNIEYLQILKLIYNATLIVKPAFNDELYNFSKDIQNLYIDSYKSKNDIPYDTINFKPINSIENENKIPKNLFNDEIGDKIYVLNYYINYGSLPEGYQHYNLIDLKNLLNYIFIKDQKIVHDFLINIEFKPGFGNRIFNILNSTNYKYAIDIFLKPVLYININDIHKSFIQLLISQNRSKTIFLSNQWKEQLIELIYANKFSIKIYQIFQLYLEKYADEHQFNMYTAVEIYHKDLLLHNNHLMIEKLISAAPEIVKENNIEDYIIDIQPSKGFFDLLKFILDNGFIPWWGSNLFKNNFKNKLDDFYRENYNELLKLLVYSNKQIILKNRLNNLFGEEKINNLIYEYIKTDQKYDVYKYLQEHFFNITINGVLLNQQNIFTNLLWDTLNEHNFKSFTTSYFIKKYIIYISNIIKIPTNNIIEKLLNPEYKSTRHSEFEEVKNIINDLDRDFIENNYYNNKKIDFENIIIQQFNDIKSSNTLFENYLNYITKKQYENRNLHTNNAKDILINILNQNIVPKKFKIKENNYIEILIIKLIEYLYESDKSSLNEILNKYEQFFKVYKLILTDWIFTNKENIIATYVANIILPKFNLDNTYLEIDYKEENSLFRNKNEFNSGFIENVNRTLGIAKSSSNKIRLDKYENAVNQYLQGYFINKNILLNDELLKFLIIIIYQKKGTKTLIDIFSKSAYKIGKNYLLTLFENAKNIQERHIYNSLVRTIPIVQYSSVNDLNLIQNEKDPPISLYNNNALTLYELVSLDSKIQNLSETKYIEELIKILQQFLQYNKKPVFLESLNNNLFKYYLQILVNEISIKSPSNFYTILLNKNNNKRNILYIYELYINASNGIELTIKNIFIDFFRNYTIEFLKSYYKIDIALVDLDFIKFHTQDLKKLLIDFYNKKEYFDLQYFLHAQFNNNNYFEFSQWLDKYLVEDNIFDKFILNTYINLLKTSFTNNEEIDEINYIVNKSLIIPLVNNRKFNNNVEFLDNLMKEIINHTNFKSKVLLNPIIKNFENKNISQPKQLVELIEQTILKSKSIINTQYNNIDKSFETKDTNIFQQVKKIKKQYNSTINKQRNEILKNEKLNSNNSLEDLLKNESIYINNIGLVLFHLFIPTFFNRLNLLNTDGDFINIDCQYRAVHLLQLLISEADYDEHELVLNKILCNLEINEIIPMDIEFTEQEKALCLELMSVIIQRWEKMSNSSIGHFRAAFLMRDGRLKLKADGWYLNVEKRGYDIILSTIPWAFGVIKFKWMHKFLYTEWT